MGGNGTKMIKRGQKKWLNVVKIAATVERWPKKKIPASPCIGAPPLASNTPISHCIILHRPAPSCIMEVLARAVMGTHPAADGTGSDSGCVRLGGTLGLGKRGSGTWGWGGPWSNGSCPGTTRRWENFESITEKGKSPQ